MVQRTRLFPALLTGLLALWGAAANEAQAAGYAIFTQGAAALGQGNAVTAHGEGPSSIFYNPALLGDLEGTQLEVGTTAVLSRHRFASDQPGGTASSNDSTFFPSTLYLSHTFNGTLSAGFGLFTPFGLGTKWGNGWDGRYLATTSTLQSFDLNPVLCYRVLPSLAVAAGLDIILVDATLERQFPPAVFGTPFDVGQKFKGSGTGIGYNVGLAYRMNDEFSFGASYRSEARVELKGDASTSLGGTPLDSGGRTSIVLPQQVTAGLAWRVGAPLTVEAGIRWEGWSAFNELSLALDNGTPLPATLRRWHDSFGFNLGGRYRLNDTLALSAGYVFGNSAVPDGTFDPSIPDAQTHVFCLGTDLDYGRYRIALAYAYQLYLDRTKNNSVDPQLPPHYGDGRYQSDAHLVALSLGYRF